MKCAFCFYSKPFSAVPAEFVVDGISVCEEHVDQVSGTGFGKDLLRLNQESDEEEI